jgi:hypothetical protein
MATVIEPAFHRGARRLAAFSGAIFLVADAASTAHGQSLQDPATGFGVAAPQGYVVLRSPPQVPFEVVFIVTKPNDNVSGCRVSFQPEERFADLSQDQLNKLPDNPDMYRSGLAASFDVRSVDPFETAGVRGAVIVADFKPEAQSENLRSLTFAFYIPKGPVRVACVGYKSSFDAVRPEFETVARGVVFPR